MILARDAHPAPALTGRATDWRGPPDRGRSVRHQASVTKGADSGS
jgi:hypothetical protein